MRSLLVVALSIWSGLSWAAAGTLPPGFAADKAMAAAPRTTLPALNLSAIQAEDDAVTDKSRPWRYAVPLPVSGLKAAGSNAQGGSWSDLADGRKLWRFEVEATAAKTVDLLFQPYRLPHDAELWLYTPDRKSFAGPYTDEHNNADSLLATPALAGSTVIVEVVVPADRVQFMELALKEVYSGYRGFDIDNGVAVPKLAGSCNVDSICPQGDAFRSQIQAAVAYKFSGFSCSGTLMNNTAQDGSPLFLTARHCFSTQADASRLVLYYNYASPSCRVVGSGANGTPLPTSISSHTQTGATLLASATRADFTLVRLNQNAPTGANPFFAGWDRRAVAPASATGIHHPQGEEKRISAENNPLSFTTSSTDLGGGLVLQAGDALRVNDWDVGTTEQGSSGSALFSPAKQVVGTLSGGFAACGNNLEDYYGSLAASFTGSGTAATRLSDHLDPVGSGAQTLDGRSAPTGCSLAATISQTPDAASVMAGTEVRFSATLSGGTAPYTASWDVDSDNAIDRSGSGLAAGVIEVVTRYNRAQTTNVVLRVTDAGGCQLQTQRAVNVVSHNLALASGSTDLQLNAICADNDNQIEPGEHWALRLNLTNSGGAAPVNGVAIFSPQSADSGFRVVKPAVAIPANQGNGQANFINTEFYIDPTALCSSQNRINFVGVADDNAVGGSAVSILLPTPTSCSPVLNCPAPAAPANAFRNGAFFNPSRSGNGLISYLIPQQNSSPQFYAQWFTGDDSRDPAWYYLQTRMVDGQARGDIVKRTRNVGAASFSTTDAVVGTGQVTVVDNERLVFTHQLNGKARGGDRMLHLLSGLPASSPNRTGAWYFTSESGWGQTYDSYLQSGVAREFVLTYVYDNAGQPRWVSSGDAPAGTATFAAIRAPQISCPTCAWVAPEFVNAGTITRQFNSASTGVLSTSFNVPVSGSWVRNGVPIILLTTPQP